MMISKEILRETYPLASVSYARFKDHDFYLIKYRMDAIHVNVPIDDAPVTILLTTDTVQVDAFSTDKETVLSSIGEIFTRNNKQYE